MKRVLFLILILIPTFVYSQRLKEYTASNGITYHKGDTITLGIGSMPNGDFKYLQMGGFFNTLSVMNGDYNSISSSVGRNYSGLNVIIRKIKQMRLKGAKKVYFVVGGGNITNYNLMIEQAIATCEIKDCNQKNENKETKTVGKYDKLMKLKSLYDEGALTKEEYKREKVKVLGNN